MIKEQNWNKPVRQSNKDQKNVIKSSFPQRNGNRTAKNVEGQSSKETFEEFVNRMKNQTSKAPENQYETRVRPSTCGGYGQLRI